MFRIEKFSSKLLSSLCQSKSLQQYPRYQSVLADRYLDLVSRVVKDAALDTIPIDCATNSKLWLSPPSVNTPTVSILEPSLDDCRIDYLRLPLEEDVSHETYSNVNPFEVISDDLSCLSESIRSLIGSGHPVLERVAQYLFESNGGKKIRPAMVLLVARAIAAHCRATSTSPTECEEELQHIATAQQRLAEITELIHTASLLHDDVIDKAETRRHGPSVNKLFGNKLAILAGDFLLARASVSIARLRDIQVLEIMSTVIEHLVKGEVMQMQRSTEGQELSSFEYYLRKNYYKTGSLMANSCRAGAVLGKHSENLCNLAFAYGKHIGLAFQLIDDVLDYNGSKSGKPLLADLRAGIATAPILLAQEQYPQLRTLIDRKFNQSGDIELAANLVEKSNGIQDTKNLAFMQVKLACEAVDQLAPSPERSALIQLAHMVIDRTK